MYSFFLFVNRTSGGNRAGVYLQLQAETIKFNLKHPCTLDIIDLFDKASLSQGIEKLKSAQGMKRAVVCGGDGTVMWVVEELVKAGIDLQKCPIGILPFGTGNDFSRVLGWGPDTSGDLGQCLSNLKGQINEWMEATVEDFDIWEVNIVAYENGYFQKIQKTNDGFQKQQIQQKQIKKKMCNYFSFGVDARIGYGFDKKRTSSAFCNKIVYCCEGFKKMFLSNPTTNQVLQSMEIIADDQVDSIKVDNQHVKEVLFKTQANQHKYTLKNNPVTLLCVNIPSYSGGAGAIWQNSIGQVGIKQSDNQLIQDQFKPQIFGDGLIEFVSFNTIVGMANERFLHGQAQRVAQGKGPFLFRFKESIQGQLSVNQYFQVDGEYYHVVNPSHITIYHSKEIPQGKIKVLVKKNFRIS